MMTARCSEPKRLERLPIVLTNYMEAFLYPEEAGYNEEANAVLGRPKGGVRGRGDMKPGAVKRWWKDHTYGMGPYSDRPFQYKTVEVRQRRTRGGKRPSRAGALRASMGGWRAAQFQVATITAMFADAEARGNFPPHWNPGHTEEVRAMKAVLKLLMSDIPVNRVDHFTCDMAVRVVRVLDLRKPVRV